MLGSIAKRSPPRRLIHADSSFHVHASARRHCDCRPVPLCECPATAFTVAGSRYHQERRRRRAVDKSDLKAGARVFAFVNKKLPDGWFETTRVSVGRDGITPPMERRGHLGT